MVVRNSSGREKGRHGMFTHNHFCLGLGTVATLWVGQRAKVRETLQGTRDGKI